MDNEKKATQEKHEKGLGMLRMIATTLEDLKLVFETNEDRMLCTFLFKNDDMEHRIIVQVNDEDEYIRIVDLFPFKIPTERYPDAFEALSRANYGLKYGMFSIDCSDGVIQYEILQMYQESLLGAAVVKKMVLATINIVEQYDDKLFAIGKGFIKASEIT